MLTTYLISIMILIAKENCFCKRYDNYTLFRAIPVNEKHLKFYKELQYRTINFWKEPSLVDRNIEFIIGPEDMDNFVRDARQMGLYYTTVMKDIQRALDMQTVKIYTRRRPETFDWKNYYNLDDIYNWLLDLVRQYPNHTKLIKIGTTYEKREIIAMKIKLNKGVARSTVIIEGGIHAREWISHAMVTYLINTLIHASSSQNEELKTIAELYEWYFIPVVNPDGYAYSHKEDRMWRKNRHKFGNSYGVDLNRNFGFSFGTTGVSSNPTSDIYNGPKEFSELEAQAVASFIKSKSANLEYYIAFHSYGQFMILPYAHTKSHLDNFDEMKSILTSAASAIKRKHGSSYTIGNAYETVGYMTSGVSSCWVKRVFRVPYVVTFELRDSGKFGFALPTEQIQPTCEEITEGLMKILKPKTDKLKKMQQFNKQSCSFLDIVLLFICDVIAFFVVR